MQCYLLVSQLTRIYNNNKNLLHHNTSLSIKQSNACALSLNLTFEKAQLLLTTIKPT